MAEDLSSTVDGNPVVLIVDDDQDIRDAVASILRVEGYEVAVACDGKEALDWLGTVAPPSLVLLDLMMPVMDGRAFLHALERDEALAGIPVVVFTAFADRADRSLMRPVLRKPLNVNELIETVAGYCEPGWQGDEPPTERRPMTFDP